MYRKYIQAVEPLDDHILLIDFTSGSRLLLDMKPYLDSIRFRSLVRPEVWEQRRNQRRLCPLRVRRAEPRRADGDGRAGTARILTVRGEPRAGSCCHDIASARPERTKTSRTL